MNKALLSIGVSSILMGCTSASYFSPEPIVNKIEIGTKKDASGVIVLNYYREKSEPKYQNYDIYLYVSDLPENNNFTLCDFDTADCDSSYSVWKNIWRPDQNGVWFNSTLKLPTETSDEQVTPVHPIKTVFAESFLEWNKTKNINSHSAHATGKITQQSSLSATAYKLR